MTALIDRISAAVAQGWAFGTPMKAWPYVPNRKGMSSMGLDMYLTGRKFFTHANTEKREEDGFELESVNVRLGYWRKHPDLHGYIVATFAEGLDECQEIELNLEQLGQLIEAVKTKQLVKTTGFFFGQSDGTETDEDVEILSKAVAWLTKLKEDNSVWLSVVYRASW